jgi:hypothetical protein
MAVLEFTTSGSFTTAADTTYLAYEMWGGGGAGGGVTAANSGGGGGAGGCYVCGVIACSPSTTYSFVVGAARNGVSGADGGNGNDTTLTIGATVLTAKGGAGGTKDNGAGGVGSTTGCVGDTAYSGGSGGTGDATHGSGGGSAAGSTGNGNNGSISGPGVAKITNPGTTSGVGGSVRTTEVAASPGAAYGGGGGGALNLSSSTPKAGGQGAAGYIRITEIAAAAGGGTYPAEEYVDPAAGAYGPTGTEYEGEAVTIAQLQAELNTRNVTTDRMGTLPTSGTLATATDLTTAKNEIVAAMPGMIDPRGTGADLCTITITREDATPIPDADVWIKNADGTTVVAGTLQTDSEGNATFLLDDGSEYLLYMQKNGENPISGEAFTAEADA